MTAPWPGDTWPDTGGGDEGCTCYPCTTPAYGAPGHPHCAACCYGTLIAEYDHDCPVAEHRAWAWRQFPSGPDAAECGPCARGDHTGCTDDGHYASDRACECARGSHGPNGISVT